MYVSCNVNNKSHDVTKKVTSKLAEAYKNTPTLIHESLFAVTNIFKHYKHILKCT